MASQTAADIAARQPLRYASYAWDAETGMYYCSARTYDPETMQFISKDPARADGEESAYQYCGGDPVGKVDPSGEHSHRYGAHGHPIPDVFISNPHRQYDSAIRNGVYMLRWRVYVYAGYYRPTSWALAILIGMAEPYGLLAAGVYTFGEMSATSRRSWTNDLNGFWTYTRLNSSWTRWSRP